MTRWSQRRGVAAKSPILCSPPWSVLFTMRHTHGDPRLLNKPAPKLKYHTHPEQVRKELDISQAEAARILGISKNTWIRWETGKSKFDRTAVGFLRNLVDKEIPAPCSLMKKPRRTFWKEIYMHVQLCGDCQKTIQFLASLTRTKRDMVRQSTNEHRTSDPREYTPRQYRKLFTK